MQPKRLHPGAVSPKRMIRREKVPSLPGILDSCKVREVARALDATGRPEEGFPQLFLSPGAIAGEQEEED